MKSLKERIGDRHFNKRLEIESGYRKGYVLFGHWKVRLKTVEDLLDIIKFFLKITGLWYFGVKNTLDYRINGYTHSFKSLPPAFDNFKILHISDLHIDGVSDQGTLLKKTLKSIEADMLVITGDFRYEPHKGTPETLAAMKVFLEGLHYPEGIYAVLGNHDAIDLVEPMEMMGLKFLVNESVEIRKDKGSFWLSGVDDPHFFQLYDVEKTLGSLPKAAFKVFLAHSAEIAHLAEEAGADLYLCGHSHGGQICLPGGIPVIANMRCERRYFKGLWHHGPMIGYTSSGSGASGIPVRFFSRPEITLHHLSVKRS